MAIRQEWLCSAASNPIPSTRRCQSRADGARQAELSAANGRVVGRLKLTFRQRVGADQRVAQAVGGDVGVDLGGGDVGVAE